MREQIEARLGLEAFDSYGLSEIMGPGVSGEEPHPMRTFLDGTS